MTSPFEAIRGFRDATELDVTQLQTTTVTQNVSASMNPGWLCRYPIGDVTYPEFMLNTFAVGGTSGAASTGTAHTHSVGSFATQLSSQSIAQNNSRGGYITVSNPMIIDTVGAVISKDVGTLNNVFLEVFQENQDGSLSRLVSEDIAIYLFTTAAYVEVTLLNPVIVQAGERYLVRVRNSSSVATAVNVVCMSQGLGPVDASMSTTGSTDTNKTSYTGGEAATNQAASTSLPFFLIATAAPVATEKSWADDFNRNDLGGLWTVKQTGLMSIIIVLGQAGWPIGASEASTATAIFARPTLGDDQRVDGRLWLTDYLPGFSGPVMHANKDMSSLVWLAVSNTAASIYSGAYASLTQRATVSTTGSNEVLWSLYYQTSTNTYTALRDGQDIGLSWEDTGNVVPKGYDYRYGGLRVETVLQDGDDLAGGLLDNWNLRDWQVPA